MNFRPYEENDAKEILNWIKDEREFRLWSADRYGNYPISSLEMNNNYIESKKISKFYPFTLEDDRRIVGHLIMRTPEENDSIIRLGFVIVNSKIRRKGYGKQLIKEAIKYAKENLKAKKINLGVFTCNESAIKCYEAVGFRVVNIKEKAYQFHDEQWDQAEMILK